MSCWDFRQDKQNVINWIKSEDFDAGNYDDDDLEEAFFILFEREADDQDREEGLASHICTFLE